MSSWPLLMRTDYFATSVLANMMRRRVSAVFTRVKQFLETDTTQLSKWDVYVQWCAQFPGLALPLNDLLSEPVHAEEAMTDQAQSPIESFRQCDTILSQNSSS